MLQKAYPGDERFWSTPGQIKTFLAQNGVSIVSTPQSSSPVSSRSIHSTSLRPVTNADTSAPVVTTFGVIGSADIAEGETMKFSIRANDSGGSGIKAYELFRALDENGSPNASTWTQVLRFTASGNSIDFTIEYKPQSFGTFHFGVHVVDNAGNVGVEPATIKRVVKFDPNKQCPGGFNYEALWLARDAETVAEIAKELIPEDAITSVAYTIAAVAWSVARGMKFTVEQIYQRNADCQQERMMAKLDQPVGSRATQSSVDSVKSKLDSLDFSRLDTNVGSRADQNTVNSIKIKVDGLNLTNLDAKVSSRAAQTTAESIKSKVDSLDTVRLDVPVSTRATEVTLNNRATSIDMQLINILGKLNTLDTANVDAAVSSRASQTSVDQISNTMNAQERLQVQVIELDRGKRYLAYVTKRGAPVAGATLQQFQVLAKDKNKALVATSVSPVVKEVAPGVHDVTFDVKDGETVAYTLTFSHSQGATALAGSTIWADHQVQD